MFKKVFHFSLAKSIGAYINFLSYIAPEKSFVIAYKFFSEPRKGKINLNKLPEILSNTKQNSIRYKNHQFHTYTWKGNNEIILLIHGWESNSARWRKLIPYLKKTGKTIISIDAPAHGLTSGKEFNVPLYAEFINVATQKYNPKIVIGHSIGGNAITYFQAHYPYVFEKIILLGAPSDFNVILNNYIKMLGLNSKTYVKFKDYTKHRFEITIDEFSAAKFMIKNTTSGMIAHDINDKVVLFEEGKKLSKAWKTAQFIETKNLGHSMHNNSLYETIFDFIQH